MKRVLVTGATGFIGRHCLSSLLEQGYEVHALSSSMRPDLRKDISWHYADLLDAQQVEAVLAETRPTHLLHFAWFVEPGVYWDSLENFRWVRASLALLEAFSKNGGQHVVMAGTCAEYDWRYGYCSEVITPTTPATAYGTCKLSLQRMLDVFARQAKLRSAWGRIFFLYGPHEYPSRLVPSVTRSLLKGEAVRCTHGKQLNDFLYVQDVADAFVALLDSAIEGPVNIGSGQPIPVAKVISEIASKLNRHDLVQLGAIPMRANEPPLLTADVTRLRTEVGWLPKYDLDRGLEETIEWWRNQMLKGDDRATS